MESTTFLSKQISKDIETTLFPWQLTSWILIPLDSVGSSLIARVNFC
jgi:hypothetical protein